MRSTQAHLKQALSEVSESEKAEFNELQGNGLDYRVELGLRLISRTDENLSPIDGWTLFGGYPFARVSRFSQDLPGSEIDVLLRAGRYHLEPMHRRAVWESALRGYLRHVPRSKRLYDFPETLQAPATLEKPSLAAGRTTVYDHLLSTDVPFTESKMKIAEPGDHVILGRQQGLQGITIPENLPEPDVRAMNLALRADRLPFDQSLDDLEKTASFMADLDQTELPGEFERKSDDWDGRFQSMELLVRDKDGDGFSPAKDLVIDGILNLIGIPGVGKSTLRDILTAHAVARLRQHVVIVVGDVAEALRTVQRFNRLRKAAELRQDDHGFTRLRAAPLIGTTTREQHLRRLHRRVSRRYRVPTLQYDPAFGFLSTACPLSALRGPEVETPLAYGDAPCTNLRPVAPPPDTAPPVEDLALPTIKAPRGCPLWSFCPRHDTARALRDATIWVATPESLSSASLPSHQNSERVRYLELACRRSDLIIVDEADQVQIRLDGLFAPTATLYKPGTDSWLDELLRHNVAELALRGRIQLSRPLIKQWTAALDLVSTTANRIYAMLVEDDQLRTWVGADFFSAWSLQQELLDQWPATRVPAKERAPDQTGGKKRKKATARSETARLLALLDGDAGQPQEVKTKRRKAVQTILDDFRDDPLGDGEEGGLSGSETYRLTELTRRLITNSPDNSHVERGVCTALQMLSGLRDPAEQSDGDTTSDEALQKELKTEFEREQRRFEFTLLLSVMHHRLNTLTALWGQVETELRLDPAANGLYHRTPLDYAPVVPESPMGNVLAFQFASDKRTEYKRTGELRFIRCHGVGRELMHALPSLHSVEGSRGPNVLLMSGTSWAGVSTRYHIAEPVKAVLRASAKHEQSTSELHKPSGETAEPTISIFESYVHERDESTGRSRPLFLSGSADRNLEVLQKMIRGLADPLPTGGMAPLTAELQHLRNHRKDRANLLLLTGSYKQARTAAQTLYTYPFWKERVCVLVSDDLDLPAGEAVDAVPTLRRGDVASLRETPYRVLVAPLMAVERGHNILNSLDEAFFGSVYFLTRPFPAPSDMNVLIHALNDWTVRATRTENAFTKIVRSSGSLDAAGLEWRRDARRQLHWLANRELQWKRLTSADRERLTWDLLVVIWQVIGRLTRGGVDARVHFVDAAYAPRRAAGKARETSGTSLLVSMHDVLALYLGRSTITVPKPNPGRLPVDSANIYLVEALYRPLFDALSARLSAPPPPVPAEAPPAR